MIIQALLIVFVYFTTWYIVGVIIKNASIIDIGWGPGFVLIALIGFIQNISLHSAVVTALVSVWGLRLGYHIFKRNYAKPEDFRYANFRREWGKVYYVRSYFQLFMFQAVMMFLISLAFIYANNSGVILNIPLVIIGIIVWLTGFLFEVIGDNQLKRFISDKSNKGKLINTGLWKYTRHPNYFGEAVLWWGIFIIAVSYGAPWFTIISPVTITILVRYVSGVPMLEKRLKKKDGYEDYVKSTSIFIPRFPKGEKK